MSPNGFSFFIFSLLLLFSDPALSSAFVECDVNIELKKVGPLKTGPKNNAVYVQFKVLSIKQIPTGFGQCPLKADQEVTTNLILTGRKKVPKAGDKIIVHHNHYSGMGPDGPVSNTRWSYK